MLVVCPSTSEGVRNRALPLVLADAGLVPELRLVPRVVNG